MQERSGFKRKMRRKGKRTGEGKGKGRGKGKTMRAINEDPGE